VAQVVNYLPTKSEALSSRPNATKKRREKEKSKFDSKQSGIKDMIKNKT
jgi:hypothetical protein